MTHADLTAAVRSSEQLAPSSAERHGTYRNRHKFVPDESFVAGASRVEGRSESTREGSRSLSHDRGPLAPTQFREDLGAGFDVAAGSRMLARLVPGTPRIA